MTAIYPGSFDPVTRGHIDIIERAAAVADELIVAVLHNPAKTPLFSVAERMAFLRDVTRPIKNVRVDAFSGLLAAYARQVQAHVLIRGVRSAADYEYESGMARINRVINEGLETLLLVADPSVTHISGSAVRELAYWTQTTGFDDTALDQMVPPAVKAALQARYQASTGGC